jgi:outer membrane cobalamin receptor
VKYAFAKHWSAELSTTNLGDKRYENAVGYDAPRRGAFLQVSFQAF